jgi:hypothetical protein
VEQAQKDEHGDDPAHRRCVGSGLGRDGARGGAGEGPVRRPGQVPRLRLRLRTWTRP